MSQFNYRFDKEFDKKEITNCLSKYGIAVIDEFLDTNQLKKLRNECESLLNINDQDRIERNKSVMQKITLNKLDKQKFSSVYELPQNEFFNFVAKDFFNPYPYQVPFAYIHKDVNKIDFNGAWHQDPST